jgi:hypothetical protein
LPPGDRDLSEGEIVDDNNNDEQKAMSLYKERVQKVRELMDLPDLLPQEGKDICMSVEEGATKVKQVLPAPKNFVNSLQGFLDEVKGVGRKKGLPMEVGAFPKWFQPRVANYEVESCPWSVEALVTDPELYQSSLWQHNDNPQLRISQKKIMEWETSNRESLSVAAC